MNWGTRRQLIYIGFFLLVIAGIAFYFVYPRFNVVPSCIDNKKNGDETGIDCGGMCANYCPSEVNPLVVLWARSFPVSTNQYSSVAYIENQNTNAGIREISYKFKIYDGNNILITDRSGKTFVGPNGRTAIFEPGILVGNRVPKRTLFEFTTAQNFIKINPAFNDLRIFAKDPLIQDEATVPKVQGTLQNNSLNSVTDVPVVALIYDEFGNAVAVSNTIVDSLPANSSKNVFFSWPEPFGVSVRKIEIIPRLNPFTISYQ
jgi:hypothetical protein